MSFTRTVRQGNKAEDFVISLFEKIGWFCEKSKKGTPGWDFSFSRDGVDVYTEIKYDKRSDFSGNLAIEYWNPKKNSESGLTVSKADFWIYCFNSPLEAHLVTLKDLISYINNNNPIRIVDVGGDNNASLLLYRRDDIVKNLFWRIDSLDENSFKTGISYYLTERYDKFYKAELEKFIEG